jgi:hypothetical protein
VVTSVLLEKFQLFFASPVPALRIRHSTRCIGAIHDNLCSLDALARLPATVYACS